MLSLFKRFWLFCVPYLFYTQVILLSLTIMSLMFVEWPHTPYLLWLNIPLGLHVLYLHLKRNLRLRRNKTLILLNVMEAVDENPNLNLKQILNRLSIEYPLVPYAFFKEAADEAIANQYMGVQVS